MSCPISIVMGQVKPEQPKKAYAVRRIQGSACSIAPACGRRLHSCNRPCCVHVAGLGHMLESSGEQREWMDYAAAHMGNL